MQCKTPNILLLVNVTFIPVFKRAGIEEWRDKTVFLCCDGAAVNVGRKNGVAAKLRVDVGHLVAVHWSSASPKLSRTTRSYNA